MHAKQLIPSAALLLLASAASSAWAHAKLQAAEPKAGSTVAAAPAQLRLQFNEALEAPFSKIKLVDARNKVIAPSTLAVDKGNPKMLVATVPPLASGTYRVQWSTVTRDGHKVNGEYAFSVK